MPKPSQSSTRKGTSKASAKNNKSSGLAKQSSKAKRSSQYENNEEEYEKPSVHKSREDQNPRGKPQKQAPKTPLQLRAEQMERQEQKQSRMVIIIAAAVILILLSTMFGGILVDNSRIKAVKEINTKNDTHIQDYFKLEPIQAVAKSGQSAVRKLNNALDEEIEKNGVVSLKNSLIAGLAYTYLRNPTITNSNDTCELLKKIYLKNDGNLNRDFAIQALAYLPQGKKELESIIRSKEIDAEASLMALNSIPKSATGKIAGDVLIFALEKNDPDFLKQILPLVNENIEEFKEQPKAVKTLLRLSGNLDEEISQSAVNLLGLCVYKPEHYNVLKNDALSDNAKVRNHAIGALVKANASTAGPAIALVLENSREKEDILKLLQKIGHAEFNAYYASVVKHLDSQDRDIVIAALHAIGSMKCTADKGLAEVLNLLETNGNPEIKAAAAVAVRGYELRKPFYYTSTPKIIPSYVLIKLIDSPDENLKKEIITTLEKISGERQISASDWKAWFAKEKSVLDILIEMDAKYKVVQSKLKATQFKEAKEEFRKMEELFIMISNEYSRRWQGFDKYLQDRGNDINIMKVTVNKHSPI